MTADLQLAQLDECLRLLGGPVPHEWDGGLEGDYADLFVSDDEARWMQRAVDSSATEMWGPQV